MMGILRVVSWSQLCDSTGQVPRLRRSSQGPSAGTGRRLSPAWSARGGHDSRGGRRRRVPAGLPAGRRDGAGRPPSRFTPPGRPLRGQKDVAVEQIV
jgi:hypothetical protein